MDINRPSISGNYGFATTGTALPGNTSTGFAFASFLSGFADSFSMRETEPLDRYNYYLAGFVQDDWKITRTFTDRKSTRLNSSHQKISYAVFCLKKKKKNE